MRNVASKKLGSNMSDVVVAEEAGAPMPSLGDRLRKRRKELRLTLQDVSGRTGLSIGFISQIERGKTYPSLISLTSICNALSVEVAEFFKPSRLDHTVVTRDSRRRAHGLNGLEAGSTVTYERLTASFPGHKLLGMISHEPPGFRYESMSHEGEELLYVLKGAITVEVDGEAVVLEAGDSAHFPSTMRHATFNHTTEVATLMNTCTMDVFGEEQKPDPLAIRFVVTRAADR